MKQRMNEFEESLNWINIINSITELKRKIGKLEHKLKYSLAYDNLSSNIQINNRNEDSKEEQKLHDWSNSIKRSNKRPIANYPIMNQNADNFINWPGQNLCDESMSKNLAILEQFNFK